MAGRDQFRTLCRRKHTVAAHENAPSRGQDDPEETVRVFRERLQDWQRECDGLSGTGLGGSDTVGACLSREEMMADEHDRHSCAGKDPDMDSAYL